MEGDSIHNAGSAIPPQSSRSTNVSHIFIKVCGYRCSVWVVSRWSFKSVVQEPCRIEHLNGRDILAVFPVELILQILQFLDDSDLYSFSFVCADLHRLVTPLYLEQQHLSVPCPGRNIVFVSEPWAFEALAVWRNSLEFQAPKYIYCWFSHDPVTASADLDHLQRFFSTLHGSTIISQIHLYLQCRPPSGLTGVLEGIRWMDSTHLRVHHPTSAVLKHTMCPAHLLDLYPHQFFPQLTVFQINAASMFSPNLFHWTLQTINHSSLTELDLITAGLSSVCWSRILPRINVPTLLAFHIDGDIPMNVLDVFFVCHKNIKSLHIGLHSILACQTRSTRPSLAALKDLDAPLSYILHLLGPSTSSLLPLEQLSISPDEVPPCAGQLNTLLQRLFLCIAAYDLLWRLTFMLPPQELNCLNPLSLNVHNVNQRQECFLTSVHSLSIRKALSGFWPYSESFIENIVVRSHLFLSCVQLHSMVNYQNCLSSWISLFLAVTSVDLWEGRGPARDSLLGSLRSNCPQLTTIAIYSGSDELEWV